MSVYPGTQRVRPCRAHPDRGRATHRVPPYGAGRWFPNKVARQLPEPLHFAAVWVVGLQGAEAGKYTYGVTHMDVSGGNAAAWLVRIAKDFDAWEVTPIQ